MEKRTANIKRGLRLREEVRDHASCAPRKGAHVMSDFGELNPSRLAADDLCDATAFVRFGNRIKCASQDQRRHRRGGWYEQWTLSQMDVPTRSSYVMAVVTPAERPAAASTTAVPRSLAAAGSPLLIGYLLSLSAFGCPPVVAGAIKSAYDITLLMLFRNVRPPEEVEQPRDATARSLTLTVPASIRFDFLPGGE